MPDTSFLGSLKRENIESARERAIPITRGNEVLGMLVPVGSWILADETLIEAMASWRARTMEMFLAQFESTPAKTANYLQQFSIGLEQRILFMIESDGIFLGHIGLANIHPDTAEIDNVMRGINSGPRGLMSASERSLAEWAFVTLDLSSLYLRVLSNNTLAKRLYERDGFVTTESLPLRRESAVDGTVLVPCSQDQASVSFTCDVMTLDRERFLAHTGA
ncbi:MAG: GNAT family N-acetyltransferase [Candidatus Nanopelagicales bacterium]|nr:GNAT family N-acetyltransferase [Candidatus Nanopelagicales bacterium]